MAESRNNHPSNAPPVRRGSTYILVLAASSILMVIGLAAISLCRIQLRQAAGANNSDEAGALAFSAVEHALTVLNKNPQWRGMHTNNIIVGPMPLGSGTIEWKLVDEADGDLSDDPADPVRLYGTGRSRGAVRIFSVLIRPKGIPLDVLRTCIHTGGQLQVMSGKSLTTMEGPASTNGNFRIDGILYGDIEAATRSGGGIITGNTTIPAPQKALPSPNVFMDYVAKATALPYSGHIDGKVLAPGVNEYGGGLNSEGVYYINTMGSDLTIQDSRISGTLVINAGTRKVVIDKQVLMESYRQDYPVLIVKGLLEIRCDSKSGTTPLLLSEAAVGHNFNPPGAKYKSSEDHDLLDSYPSRIEGLVHVIGDLKLADTPVLWGTIICEGQAVADNAAEIMRGSALLLNPPQGYLTASSEMAVDPTSWRWEVNP